MSVLSLSICTGWISLVSSANLLTVDLSVSPISRSFMYIKKHSGPRTDPCTTELVTGLQLDLAPWVTTFCLRLLSQAVIHCNMLPSIPWALIFVTSLLCGTVLKAFARSRYTTSTGVPLSTDLVMISRYSSKLVVVDFPFLKPCWVSCIRPYLFRWLVILSLIMLSSTLQLTDVKLIGR